jgi:predicted ATPase
MAQICDLLRHDDTRLLTLTGVGGTGKTTLAQAVARQLRDEFSDGVFFIELAAIKQAELVASTIAQPLGVKAPDGKPSIEGLKDYLRQSIYCWCSTTSSILPRPLRSSRNC